jgi:hypothetical protein
LVLATKVSILIKVMIFKVKSLTEFWQKFFTVIYDSLTDSAPGIANERANDELDV